MHADAGRAQLGMAMFLISETVFFFLLILACSTFRRCLGCTSFQDAPHRSAPGERR